MSLKIVLLAEVQTDDYLQLATYIVQNNLTRNFNTEILMAFLGKTPTNLG